MLLDTIQSYYKLSQAELETQERLTRFGRYREVDEMAQTVFERARREAERETLQRAVQEAILTRFPDAPANLVERVERLRSQRTLEDLHRRAILAENLAEIEALLDR